MEQQAISSVANQPLTRMRGPMGDLPLETRWVNGELRGSPKCGEINRSDRTGATDPRVARAMDALAWSRFTAGKRERIRETT